LFRNNEVEEVNELDGMYRDDPGGREKGKRAMGRGKL
jgi:hypothetical protein